MKIFVFLTSTYTAIQYDLPRGTLAFTLQRSKQQRAQSCKSHITLQKVLSHTLCVKYHRAVVDKAVWWELLLGFW